MKRYTSNRHESVLYNPYVRRGLTIQVKGLAILSQMDQHLDVSDEQTLSIDELQSHLCPWPNLRAHLADMQ